MSNRAVVILTEPEHCELAGADVLTQAMLQLQQLNNAGLNVSQTFCDHPAAAMKFIEAYAKAFPELQRSAADLPLPEQLYSMVAEGRITPLSAPPTLETKPGEASQLYPLYVLSLGAPDALMRALKSNSFATSNIKIVEIAPLERGGQDSAPVTDAIAHHDHGSWRTDTSADAKHNEGDDLAAGDLIAGDPLKLDNAEVNLDHIGPGRIAHHNGRVNDDSAPTNVDAHSGVVTPSSASQGSDNGADGPPHLGAVSHGSVESPMASTTVAEAGHESEASRQPPAAAGSSIGESSLLATTEITDGAGVVTSDAEIPDARASDVASPGSESAGSSGGEDAPGGNGSVEHPGEPAVSEADASRHGDGGEQVTRGAPADHGGTDDLDDPEAEQGPAPPEPAESGTPDRTGAMPFSEPEADVMYRPNASFANDDDVSYPLPFGTGPGDLLGELLARSEHGENIDLDTIFCRLADLPGGAAGPPEDLPFSPEALRGTGSPGADAAAPDPVREMPMPDPDHHGPDQDNAGHERVPVSHDLDI